MADRRLQVRCPDCDTELVVDAATGEGISHRAAKRPLAGGKDFDSLMRGLDEGKARAAAVLAQGQAARELRQRLLDENFEEALRRAEEEPDTPPPSPFEF